MGGSARGVTLTSAACSERMESGECMAVRNERRKLRDRAVRRSLFGTLRRNVLCSMATVSPAGRAHINTAYFAWSPRVELFFYSYPTSHHGRNIARDGSMAVAVFESDQKWGRPDRGVQLFGTCSEAKGALARAAERWYVRRFPGYRRWREQSKQEEGGFTLRPYRFVARSARLFDERIFGGGVFVDVRIPPARRTRP